MYCASYYNLSYPWYGDQVSCKLNTKIASCHLLLFHHHHHPEKESASSFHGEVRKPSAGKTRDTYYVLYTVDHVSIDFKILNDKLYFHLL